MNNKKLGVLVATVAMIASVSMPVYASEGGVHDLTAKSGKYTNVQYTGTTTTTPEVVSITWSGDGELDVQFDRAMDTKTAVNSNYYQINDQNINGAKLELNEDNTVVKITNIPDGILDDGTNVILITSDIKDAYGNKMDEVTRLAFDIQADETNPKLQENTFKLYKDGDDVKADFQLDNALDSVNAEDFKVSGIAADSADFSDNKVTLTFGEGDKADAVLALGSSAVLQISPSSIDPSTDIAGRTIEAATQKVYSNMVAPETDRDNYSATATVNGSGKVKDLQLYVTLKTPVDGSILGSYKDDFQFTNITKGVNLEVESVKLVTSGSQPVLVYKIKNAAKKVAIGDKIDIIANPDEKNINLRSEKDGEGNQVVFAPSYDDLDVKTVTVRKVNKK